MCRFAPWICDHAPLSLAPLPDLGLTRWAGGQSTETARPSRKSFQLNTQREDWSPQPADLQLLGVQLNPHPYLEVWKLRPEGPSSPQGRALQGLGRRFRAGTHPPNPAGAQLSIPGATEGKSRHDQSVLGSRALRAWTPTWLPHARWDGAVMSRAPSAPTRSAPTRTTPPSPRLAEDSHGSRLKTELGGKGQCGRTPVSTNLPGEGVGRQKSCKQSLPSLPLNSQNSATPPACPADLATNPGRCHLKVTWLPQPSTAGGRPPGPASGCPTAA